MKTKRKTLLIAAILVLAVAVIAAGCANPDSEEPSQGEDSPVSGEELSQEEILALVKEDLAEREGVDVDEIGHPSVEERTWSDVSLGCPEEGMMYAEVLTPGYQILLSIGGPASIEQFDYRTDMVGNFLLCEQ